MLTTVLARHLLPFALVLLLPLVASADEKNPGVEACAGKTQGAPCSADRVVQNAAGKAEKRTEPGSCQPDQCCELDYSSGPPPKSTCGPCLACKPGPAPATTDTTANASGGEPPRTDTGNPPVVPPNDKRGCSIGENTKAEPPWWLLGLVVIAHRRRRVSRKTPSTRPSSHR